MRAKRLSILLIGLLAITADPAMAGDKLVKMQDVTFSPKSVRVALGDSVRWRNDGDLTHTTTTKKAYPSAWDRSLAPDRSWNKSFVFAGTFGFYCRPHSDGTAGMVGQVQVPIQVAPSSGNNSVRFTVRIADVVPPSRWTLQVQRKMNAGEWQMFKEQISQKYFTYRSSTDGNHRFRARLVRTNLSVVHGWSPVAVARIT